MRKLGIEIECIVSADMCEHTGGDSNCVDTVINEVRAVQGVQVTSDGSIEHDDEIESGLEFRIGHVAGETMEEKVRAVCAVLNEHDARVNTSTGLHVHADAPEINPAGDSVVFSNKVPSVMAAWDMYNTCYGAVGMQGGRAGRIPIAEVQEYGLRSDSSGAFRLPHDITAWNVKEGGNVRLQTNTAMRFLAQAECLLRASVPATRRHNQYCYPFAKMVRSGGAVPSTLAEMYRGIADRYCGINFRSVEVHGTIENRYHSGTTNAQKIIHWARTWARMVDVAMTISDEDIDVLQETVSDKARREMLLALLALPADTERYLHARIKEFANSDNRKVATFIRNKKQLTAAIA